MRQRTIECYGHGEIRIAPPEITDPRVPRLALCADNREDYPFTRVLMARGAVERLRDALTDWLESGGK